MKPVEPTCVPPRLRALLDPGTPAFMRCAAVLEGRAAGRAWTGEPSLPECLVVQESGFGSLYLGGSFDPRTLEALVAEARQHGHVLVGLWPGDERFSLLPSNPDYDGAVLEFTDRPFGQGLEGYLRQLPSDCEVQPVDRTLFDRLLDGNMLLSIFGSAEKALEQGFGLCLMRGEQILSESFAGPAAGGLIEVGTVTNKAFRNQGYATIVCAHIIRACEERGYRTYWNCDKDNLASAAVARKLGYHTEREYRLMGWLRFEQQ